MKYKRYSPLEKARIIRAVIHFNNIFGRGGIARAVKQSGVTFLTIKKWINERLESINRRTVRTSRSGGRHPNIFKYKNYRLFMRDLVRGLKKDSNSGLFKVAKMAGLASRSNVHDIIHGKLGMSVSSMVLLIKALKLKRKEAYHFDLLLHYGDAKNPIVRHYYHKLILASKRRSL